MKVGRPGFPTGSYNESGAWDIYAGNRIELTPEHRMNGVAKTDRKLMATVKEYEKAMDEGAWKPLQDSRTNQMCIGGCGRNPRIRKPTRTRV